VSLWQLEFEYVFELFVAGAKHTALEFQFASGGSYERKNNIAVSPCHFSSKHLFRRTVLASSRRGSGKLQDW
jgi:hypothetical protein